MKQSVRLVSAPTGFQPGGYVPRAYADRVEPLTTRIDVEAEAREGFRFALRWRCPDAVVEAGGDPRRFVDACALLVPSVPDAPWITMGAPGLPVEGVLWRADRPRPWAIRAEGLGGVERSEPPADWTVQARWTEGHWLAEFVLPAWPALAAQRQFALAVWQGARAERAGLKSVSEGWLPL